MIVAVFTGSRKWSDRQAVVSAFEYAEQHLGGIYYVVTGDQRGLDRLAYEVARERQYGSRTVPVHAFWNEDGRAAGNIRNGQMIRVARALALDHVEYIHGFAFPDNHSIGTWNCVDDMIVAKIKYDLRGTSDRRLQ